MRFAVQLVQVIIAVQVIKVRVAFHLKQKMIVAAWKRRSALRPKALLFQSCLMRAVRCFQIKRLLSYAGRI